MGVTRSKGLQAGIEPGLLQGLILIFKNVKLYFKNICPYVIIADAIKCHTQKSKIQVL